MSVSVSRTISSPGSIRENGFLYLTKNQVMSKQNTRATIDANIRQNGQQLITGAILNSVLNTMVTDYAEQEKLTDLERKVDEIEDEITEGEFEVTNIFATPEKYGAVGDGESDDSEAFIAALNSGKPVYCRKVYKVKDIVIDRPTLIYGGTFVDGGSSDYTMTISSANVKLIKVSLDCQGISNGVYFLENSHWGLLFDCEIYNAKSAQDNSIGVNIRRCHDVSIISCRIHDISNDNAQPTRAILSNRSNRTLIENCVVYNVISDDDGDGIQIIFDGATDEGYDRCVIRNCDFYNCSKRSIKIQQRNTLVEGCTIIASKSTIPSTGCAIAIYDTNCIVRDNYINGLSPIQIHLVGGLLDVTETSFENTQIVNNIIINQNSDIAASQGLITSSSISSALIKNLLISGNTFKGVKTSESGVRLYSQGGIDGVTVCNNYFDCNMGVYFDWSGSESGTVRNIDVSDNIFLVTYYGIYLRGGIFYSLSVNNNSFYPSESFGGLFKFVNNVSARFYGYGAIKVSNTSFPRAVYLASSPYHYTKFIEFFREYGTTSEMPVFNVTGMPLYDGFHFYNTELHKTLTYYGWSDGHWYNPDGSIFQ